MWGVIRLRRGATAGSRNPVGRIYEARKFEARAMTMICVTIARVLAPKEGARFWKWIASEVCIFIILWI